MFAASRVPIATMILSVCVLSATSIAQLLNNPESVVYEPENNCYLVSNHGGREIVRIDPDGSQSIFFSGLPAPRGMLLHQGVLCVVSDTGLTGIDPAQATLEALIDKKVKMEKGETFSGDKYSAGEGARPLFKFAS